MDTATADSVIDAALASADTNATQPAPDQSTIPMPYEDQSAPPTPTQTADQRKIAAAQEQLIGKEAADQLTKEQEEQAAREATLIGQAEKLLNSGKSSASAAGVKLSNIPTPGDLTVPLVLLVVFFFILITYNGNTRFQWLWLVLTGNAYVTTSAPNNQGSSTPPASSGIINPGTQGGGKGPLPPELNIIMLPNYNINGNYGGNPFS